MMRILMLHNRYKIRGGEDEVAEAEAALLRSAGHDVEFLAARNDEIEGPASSVSAAVSSLWSRAWHRRVTAALAARRYDIVHVHNFFPLISPSVHVAARSAGVPVVQTLHNYRLVCPSANLMRNGAACTECVARSMKWPAIRHGCYRGSRPASSAVAAMLAVHRAAGTWRGVSRYVAVSDYVAARIREGAIPAERISVKPNFVSLPTERPIVPADQRRHVLFVGRLAPEKGLDLLLEAWSRTASPMPLKVVGEGAFPAGAVPAGISFLGRRALAEVYELMREAACVVMPGRWPEPFGRAAIEAFAHGTPVVTSDLGGAAEIVEHGRTGFLFRSGDAGHLGDRIGALLADERGRQSMSAAARAVYEARYTPQRNLRMLEEIYALAARPELRAQTATAQMAATQC